MVESKGEVQIQEIIHLLQVKFEEIRNVMNHEETSEER